MTLFFFETRTGTTPIRETPLRCQHRQPGYLQAFTGHLRAFNVLLAAPPSPTSTIRSGSVDVKGSFAHVRANDVRLSTCTSLPA
jgi:hypothetical protein